MTAIVFDIPAFRVAFPAFANVTTYPDATLQAYWDAATCYIDDDALSCGPITGDCRVRSLQLMTAHLAFISTQANTSGAIGFVTSATVDKVTVSIAAPPVKNEWQWWLSLTPYGQQLLALLSSAAAGGFYVGGSRERQALRGIYSWY